MNIKKYFKFDDEPINGSTYFGRLFLGFFLLIFIIPGIWVLATTAYKRAGAFNWSKELRIFCAIIIPVNTMFNLVLREFKGELPFGIALIGTLFSIVHLVLLFKNGNKSRIIK